MTYETFGHTVSLCRFRRLRMTLQNRIFQPSLYYHMGESLSTAGPRTRCSQSQESVPPRAHET
jgi:hypothetical protein